MDLGKAAGILEHYIGLALENRMTSDMRRELSDAVEAFQVAASKIEDLDKRTTGLIPMGMGFR